MPIPAVDIIDTLTPKTTEQKARQIGESWSEKIRTQSEFSARTTEKSYLNELKTRLKEVAGGTETPQVAQSKLQATLAKLGYTPDKGFPNAPGVAVGTKGSITDLSSEARLRLIMQTNIQQARSMGQMSAGQSPIFKMTNPAWRLTRMGWRRNPRDDWQARWRAAGDAVGWEGAVRQEFVALKDSPIWDALGAGAGGFTDTLHQSYPPFAFGSGMMWAHVSRKEAFALGLDVEGADPSREELKEYIEKRDKGEIDPRDLPSQMQKKYAARDEVKTPREEPDFIFNRSAFDSANKAISTARATLNETSRRLASAEGRLASAADKLADAGASENALLDLAEGKVADITKAIESSRNGLDALLLRLTSFALPTSASEQSSYDSNCKTIENAARLYANSLNALPIADIPRELETASKIAVSTFGKNKDVGKSRLPKEVATTEIKPSAIVLPGARERIDKNTKQIADACKLKPMHRTPTVNDLLNVNLNGKGKGRGNNCQRTVFAAEMTARGYECIAQPSPKNRNLDVICKFSKKPNSEIHEYAYPMFKNPEPVVYSSKRDLDKLLESWGDGARAMITCALKGEDEGHVIMAIRANGRNLYLDNQKGGLALMDTGKIDFDANGETAHYNTCMRMDNAEINKNALKCVWPKT